LRPGSIPQLADRISLGLASLDPCRHLLGGNPPHTPNGTAPIRAQAIIAIMALRTSHIEDDSFALAA